MFTKPEDFTKSGFNFALFYANTTFEGIERLALLNLAAARSVFEASMSNLTTLLGAKDVQSFVAIQKELAAPSIEKGMEYSRNVILPLRNYLAARHGGADPALLLLLLQIWLFGVYLSVMESFMYLRFHPTWITFLFAVFGLHYLARRPHVAP